MGIHKYNLIKRVIKKRKQEMSCRLSHIFLFQTRYLKNNCRGTNRDITGQTNSSVITPKVTWYPTSYLPLEHFYQMILTSPSGTNIKNIICSIPCSVHYMDNNSSSSPSYRRYQVTTESSVYDSTVTQGVYHRGDAISPPLTVIFIWKMAGE